MSKILIVASHPDDEILGCGATVARLVKEGHEAYILILGEGLTSRGFVKEIELLNLAEQVKKAGKIIGVENPIFRYNFKDNSFDSIPLLEIVKAIENVKNEILPDIIFTHFKDDLNIDHRLTYHAVITATRPLLGETVKEIYSFEIPSSTEWAFPTSFSPDVFWDVTDTIKLKFDALKEYDGEIRNYPHPRSLEIIELKAKLWGATMGIPYAEAFKTVRVIR
jgi:LmbE family N-acetylglucosaminyl deacetylase